MNTITSPTKDQIKEFCKLLETHLLAAIDREADVEISYKQDTREVTNLDYGSTVVDVIYTGARFKARYHEKGL